VSDICSCLSENCASCFPNLFTHDTAGNDVMSSYLPGARRVSVQVWGAWENDVGWATQRARDLRRARLRLRHLQLLRFQRWRICLSADHVHRERCTFSTFITRAPYLFTYLFTYFLIKMA